MQQAEHSGGWGEVRSVQGTERARRWPLKQAQGKVMSCPELGVQGEG